MPPARPPMPPAALSAARGGHHHAQTDRASLPWSHVLIARRLDQRLLGVLWLALTTVPWWPVEVTPDLRAGLPLAGVAFLALWAGVERVRGTTAPYAGLVTIMLAAVAVMLWYNALGDGTNEPLTNVLVLAWIGLLVAAVESRARDPRLTHPDGARQRG